MTLHDLNYAIENIRSVDDIYDVLGFLARETDRVIGSTRISLEQVQELAGGLAQIRHLFSEISKAKSHSASGRDLMAVYLELEGRVKELRNDLSVTSGARD